MSLIIYPPTLDWSWMKQRPQHIMSQLARSGHTVYYCNRTQSQRPLEELEPRLYLVHQHDHWIREELSQLRAGKRAVIGVWCTQASQARDLKQLYQPDWILYDCVDDFAHAAPHEEEMVELSDAIICTSGRLHLRLTASYPARRIELIRNGYDADMQLHLPLSGDGMPDLSRSTNEKIIGYVGAWAPWVDEILIRKLAVIPGVKIVIIGAEFERKFRASSYQDNVVYLGMKSHEQLAGYIRLFDVCIIPFKITPVTLATNPIKAYEYLASGKPVVTTDMPECRALEPYLDTAGSHAEFIRKVINRLEHPGNPTARIQFALMHTWEQRMHPIKALIREIEAAR
ncbi:glycosyltransferase [Paenibacillus sp. GCM10027628]|uniref:glycosyltransferase n=1 Tax=Paenibacillus sp. GCM10027628 TaxID=3273413 RepID=UPI003639CFEF